MPRNKSREPRSGASATSEDYRSQSVNSKAAQSRGKQTRRPFTEAHGMLPEHSTPDDAQGLVGSLSGVISSDEWERSIHLDPEKGLMFTLIRAQLQASLSVLSCITKPDKAGDFQRRGSVHETLTRRESREVEQNASTRTHEFVQGALSQHGSETSSEWKVEVKRYKRVEGRTGAMDIYDETQNIEDIRRREREIQGGGNVLNVYDVYELEGSECQTHLEIASGPLIDLLRKVITFYPGEDFDTLRGSRDFLNKDFRTGAVVFKDPFVMLYAYRKKLEESLSREFTDEAKKHLELLLDFLRKEHPGWNDKLTQIEEGRCEKISFRSLWLLYPPGAPVYVCGDVDDRQVVVYSVDATFRRQSAGAGPMRDVKGPITLKCWDVKYERGAFRRTFFDLVIDPYSGARPIKQLQLIPRNYMPNEEALRKRLIARGRKYFTLKQVAQLQDYSGDCFPRVYNDVRIADEFQLFGKKYIADLVQEAVRVVVDEDAYRKKHPYRGVANDKLSETYGFPVEDSNLVDESGQPTNMTFLRCFPELGVFSLRHRRWALVKVDDLKPVEFREKAFKRLVMNKEYKGLLKALARAYMEQKANFSDIVPGKGRGLIILLHGPPECVAEKEKRPLYTISCGDLGTEPEQLEMKLKEVFDHAVAWRAVLLLDEADIFLQERNVNDLKRNALVTIFLRELEYFDGIIFMTTNRPGDIDEAFVSRIHLTIELGQPSPSDRGHIWRIFIKELEMPEKDQQKLLNAMTNFESDNLNGRQIRNAIRVASALAKHEKSPVQFRHLEEVIKNGRDYAQYIEKLNQMSAETLASQMGVRAQRRNYEEV